MKYLQFTILCLVLTKLVNAKDELYTSVILDENTGDLSIKEELLADAVSWGVFSNEVNKTGWSNLEIHTSSKFPDEIQSVAAGMVEGFLTADFILMSWQSGLASFCKNNKKTCKKLKKYLQENSAFVTSQIKSKPNDPYWYQVKLLYEQLYGLKRGYAATETGKRDPLTTFDFRLMQLGGLYDLVSAFSQGARTHHVVGSGSCSALIKLLPNNRDIFISQVTWSDYSSMLRVYKLYDLQLVNNSNSALHVAAQQHSFSSYPGTLYSGDDFYMLSSGLITQETTIDNYNKDLWQYVNGNTVMEWARTVVANRLARNGQEWVSIFSKHNSGTYNNEWMVLDYKLFTPGQPVVPGTLWVLEQMPGIVEMADLSVILKENGYWASYNLPYFKTIFDISKTNTFVAKYGTFFDYNLAPRAQIFRRDQGKVVDLESMMKMMRYNDFKNDPLSKCNCTPPYSAENAISARSDLNPASGVYPIGSLGHRRHGGTDAKITSYELFKNFTVYAVSGPTYDQQPVFKWSTSGWKRPLGHPDKWDFDPVMITWGKSDTLRNFQRSLRDTKE
ncbi:putative phospholipase B-like 2 [Xenia sp. Carnegie-2017]|uniref:putative phospholipase B-like 2 n=1 Tax=Xenia sp. Carnegie-2017 TaxID=2897299 RepID=UPI001F03FB24|nr:putative phospholipase B-like 2 [Xenia sp. Carnegie-2017]